MDPNATLEDIRTDIAVYMNPSSPQSAQGLVAEAIIEHMQALDEWLSKGGFLPKVWQGAHAQQKGADYGLSLADDYGHRVNRI